GAGKYSVVRIETVANIAIGVSPWGPFAEADASPGAPHVTPFTDANWITINADKPLPADLDASGRVLVIGKDNHRHEVARAAIDKLRDSGADVLVVDMGWPGDDRKYADVATFGASRAMGRTLLAFLNSAD